MSDATEQTKAVAKRPDRTPLSQRDPMSIARAFAASKFFKDTLAVEQAVVKIVAGEELGLGPWAAVQGITIIEGKLGLTANLMATLVQQNERHDYRVLQTTNERCEIEFGPNPAPGRDESGGWLPWPGAYGVSEFSVEDAARAELVKPRSNWVKWPKAMCFARALTQGVRTYAPEVTAGTPAYTPEELGAITNEAGEIIEEPEVVDGEIVSDNGDGPAESADEDVVDAEPETITKAAAERLYDAATAIEEIEPDEFARAVAFVLDKPVDVSTKKAATEALAQATPDEAAQIGAWIDRANPAEKPADAEGGESNE